MDIFALTVFGERLQREMLPTELLPLREITCFSAFVEDVLFMASAS